MSANFKSNGYAWLEPLATEKKERERKARESKEKQGRKAGTKEESTFGDVLVRSSFLRLRLGLALTGLRS